MKTFAPPCKIVTGLVLLFSCLILTPMKAQTIQIDSIFTADAEIFPFSPNDTIYGLSISGSVALHSDTSLVRVILTDIYGQQWMVYEAYPFIHPKWSFTIHELADETMYLEIHAPGTLKVEILNASLSIDYITLREENTENLASLQENFKEIIESAKVDSINMVIENNDMLWFAYQTTVSELSFAEKISRFGEKYNLKGIDYYSGGIYDDVPGVTGSTDNSTLVENFDWRNRHGANDPTKSEYYYDGEPEECDGGGAATTNLFVKSFGVYDGICYPRDNTHGNCREPQGSPAYRIKVTDYYTIDDFNDEVLKDSLIYFGPMKVTLDNYPTSGKAHDIALIGYGKIKEGDIYFVPANPRNPIIVDTNCPYIGHLYWIFKNSWGEEFGSLGYFNHLAEQVHILYPVYYKTPIINILPNEIDVDVKDKDNDGYWNWGISESCDLPDRACSALKDSDDSENRIGPFDENYYGVPIMPGMKVLLSPPQSIVGRQIENNSFFSFSEDDLHAEHYLHFYIENTGDAQLKLRPWGFGLNGERPVEITEIEGGSPNFSMDHDLDQPQSQVCMDNKNLFKIKFTGQDQGELIKVIIYDDEGEDIPNFEFILVYNDCETDPGYDVISSGITWSDPYYFRNKDLHIANGGSLNITGTVICSPEVDLIVEPGGKLKIDGGRLTSGCSGLWNGIDVWGNSKMPQVTEYQGMVEVKNGGMIEFADTAISTSLVHGIYTNPTGGIINCKDAIFKDNYLGVCLYPYVSPFGNPNFSRFKRTEFIITDDFYNPDNNIPDAPKCGIQMEGVIGLFIEGCSFINESSAERLSRGTGLVDLDAGCFVTGACEIDNQIPCDISIPSKFEGFDYGIRALNLWSYRTISVDSVDFIDNYRCIYLGLVNDASIIKSNFYLNADKDYFKTNDILVGIYTERCNRYQIEENSIFGVEPGNFELVGMHILNSGTDHNEVYNNYFENIDYGIIAAGENRNRDGSAGLCIKCNDFKNCIDDIYITPEGGSSHDLLGIATTQGLPGSEAPQGVNPNSMGAGNTFSDKDPNSADYNFYNDYNLDEINYTFQNSYFDKLDPIPSNNISKIPDPNQEIIYSKEASCPSHLHIGGIQLEAEKIVLSIEKEFVTSYEDTLAQYIDGGDTPGLTYDIQTSFTDDALELRQQLLDESPYLSDTVMKTVIQKENVLINTMVRDVLVANPQSAKSADILNALYSKSDPMPEYMMDEILEGKSIIGKKEELERKKGLHDALKTNAFSDILRYFKSDTILVSLNDSIMEYLENYDSPETQYQLAFCKLSDSTSTGVLDILNDIPLDYSLTIAQMNTHDDYEDLFDILIQMVTNSVGIDSLTHRELFSLADEENDIPGIFARNILILNGLVTYSEPVYLPSNIKNQPIQGKKQQNKENYGTFLKVYPNPAKSYIVIEYYLEYPETKTLITITDAFGKKLFTLNIHDTRNQFILDTRKYAPGIYFVRLLSEKAALRNQKFIIAQ